MGYATDMNNQYKTRDLEILFDVTGETIRAWASEFEAYMSPTAIPTTKGQTRIFTDSDVEVFALVAQLRQLGKGFDDAHLALANGQRGDLAMLVNQRSELDRDHVQLALARQHLATLESDLSKANERASSLHDENIRLKALLDRSTSDVENAQQRVDDVQKQMMDLQREMGRLSALLEVERSKDKSDG